MQQILFFRELDLPLAVIQKIIYSDGFNIVEALLSHKNKLIMDLNRIKNMIETIDKTIARIKGENTMRDEELYYGFDSKIQKEHEKKLVEQGIVTQEFLDECNRKVKNWTDLKKNNGTLEEQHYLEHGLYFYYSTLKDINPTCGGSHHLENLNLAETKIYLDSMKNLDKKEREEANKCFQEASLSTLSDRVEKKTKQLLNDVKSVFLANQTSNMKEDNAITPIVETILNFAFHKPIIKI